MDAGAVLDYWFGSDADDSVVARNKGGMWWNSTPTIDDDLRSKFGAQVELAGRNELIGWDAMPEGLLALILLTDQFPRNIHRNTPRAFAFDANARMYCKDGIARGFDLRLRPVQRVFHYLPLEHSESLQDQHQSVELFTGLARAAPPGSQEMFAGYLRYAERHQEIIARFGRFPHRNHILGRTSTAEEIAFLQTPGSSF